MEKNKQSDSDMAIAGLSFAIKLQEQTMIPQGTEESSQSPQDAPEEEETMEAEKLPEDEDKEEFETEVLDELASLRAEVEALVKDEKMEDKEEKQKDDTETIKA